MVTTPQRTKIALPLLGGLLGTLLVTAGNVFGNQMVPAGPFGAFTIFRHLHKGLGPEFTMALRATGLAVWVAAWFAIRNASKKQLAMTLGVWLLPLILLPPGAGDLYNYVQQGWVVLHGGDPTSTPAGAMHGPFDAYAGYWKGTTVGYPPLALATQAAMVALAGSTGWLALMFMRIPSLIGLAIIWCITPKIASKLGFDGRRSLWILALNPLILWQGVMCGHQDMFAASIAFLAAWLLMGSRGQAVLGVIVLICAAAVKPTSAVAACIAVPYFLNRFTFRGWRMRQIAILIGSGLVVGLPMVVVALGAKLAPFGKEWTHPTGDPARRSSSIYSGALELRTKVHSTTFYNAVESLSHHALVVCTGVVGIIMLVVALTKRFSSPYVIPGLCLLLICAIGPDGRPWYLIPALLCFGFTAWCSLDIVMGLVVLIVAYSGDDAHDSLAQGTYVGRQIWAWTMACGLVLAWVMIRREFSARNRLKEP